MTSTQVQQPPTLVAPTLQPSQDHSGATPLTIDYLALVFETCLDHIFPSQGLLLLDQDGQLIQSSPQARQLCGMSPDPRPGQRATLPKEISQLAQRLAESRLLFPGETIQLEDTLTIGDITLQVQAKWIDLSHAPAGIVVTLENVVEVTHQRALFDAYRYQFTPRETEVWELHLRGLSYQQIAEAFFISMNTVKRHMKSIYGKQRAIA